MKTEDRPAPKEGRRQADVSIEDKYDEVRHLIAIGKEKVESIIAGARGGYFNRLVTDPGTAADLLASCTSGS